MKDIIATKVCKTFIRRFDPGPHLHSLADIGQIKTDDLAQHGETKPKTDAELDGERTESFPSDLAAILREELKRPCRSNDGYVYFLLGESSHRVKIGWARDPGRRRNEIRWDRDVQHRDRPEPVCLLGFFEGTRIAERFLHLKLEKFRIAGEWFRPSLELLSFIAEVSEPGSADDDPESLQAIDAVRALNFPQTTPAGGAR